MLFGELSSAKNIKRGAGVEGNIFSIGATFHLCDERFIGEKRQTLRFVNEWYNE
jgi:hypothetical protein